MVLLLWSCKTRLLRKVKGEVCDAIKLQSHLAELLVWEGSSKGNNVAHHFPQSPWHLSILVSKKTDTIGMGVVKLAFKLRMLGLSLCDKYYS